MHKLSKVFVPLEIPSCTLSRRGASAGGNTRRTNGVGVDDSSRHLTSFVFLNLSRQFALIINSFTLVLFPLDLDNEVFTLFLNDGQTISERSAELVGFHVYRATIGQSSSNFSTRSKRS